MTASSPAAPTCRVVDLTEPPAGMLAEHVEDAGFYRAMHGTMPGFEFGYLRVTGSPGGDALAPYFLTSFKVGTMLPEGWLKRLIGWIGLPIACVGNPVVAFGRIDGPVDEGVVGAIASTLLRKAAIVSFKGFGPDLPAAGFVRVDGLPICVMHFDAAKWQQTRSSRNMRRKLKSSAAVRFEEHWGLPEQHADRIFELYGQTHERALVVFGRLTPEYFHRTSERSLYTLAFSGDQLVGFAQILVKGEAAVANFMGMDYRVNEALGLYFAIVIHIMDLAGQLGLKTVDLGETSYTFKRKVGCDVEPTWIYYRHRNPVMNWLLRRLAWILAPSEEELR